MDRGFIEKLSSVSEWVKQEDRSELADINAAPPA
jgi:hypothetical protein